VCYVQPCALPPLIPLRVVQNCNNQFSSRGVIEGGKFPAVLVADLSALQPNSSQGSSMHTQSHVCSAVRGTGLRSLFRTRRAAHTLQKCRKLESFVELEGTLSCWSISPIAQDSAIHPYGCPSQAFPHTGLRNVLGVVFLHRWLELIPVKRHQPIQTGRPVCANRAGAGVCEGKLVNPAAKQHTISNLSLDTLSLNFTWRGAFANER
jgi:hypothetical protein